MFLFCRQCKSVANIMFSIGLKTISTGLKLNMFYSFVWEINLSHILCFRSVCAQCKYVAYSLAFCARQTSTKFIIFYYFAHDANPVANIMYSAICTRVKPVCNTRRKTIANFIFAKDLQQVCTIRLRGEYHLDERFSHNIYANFQVYAPVKLENLCKFGVSYVQVFP